MAKKLTVVVSQGQSANPAKRKLEEDLVGALLFETGMEVTVVPHLYDLSPDGTGMLCLQGITGDMVVLSWLFPRAAHWTLNRNGVLGREGATLLTSDADEEEHDDPDSDEAKSPDEAAANGDPARGKALPNRTIYCLDLRSRDRVEPFVEEIRRIRAETQVQVVGLDLLNWVGGAPKLEQMERYISPSNGNVHHAPPASTPGPSAPQIAATPTAVTRVEESTARRWYPVIDYSRCTNCMECIDFCLFGVYGVDRAESILVEQPDNCRKGCPACSRVCPENAIIFPQHKAPEIAGSPNGNAGGLKIDLSKLFGAPDAMEVAILERDVELVAVGRDAVGMSVGIPKRQEDRPRGPKDDLDALMDQLDELSL